MKERRKRCGAAPPDVKRTAAEKRKGILIKNPTAEAAEKNLPEEKETNAAGPESQERIPMALTARNAAAARAVRAEETDIAAMRTVTDAEKAENPTVKEEEDKRNHVAILRTVQKRRSSVSFL